MYLSSNESTQCQILLSIFFEFFCTNVFVHFLYKYNKSFLYKSSVGFKWVKHGKFCITNLKIKKRFLNYRLTYSK